MSGTGKTLKERLDWLEKNDLIFKAEKQAVIETIKEMQIKFNKKNDSAKLKRA